MAYIRLDNELPGISGLLAHRRDTAKPLRDLAQTLLRGLSSLEVYERELIATYVSHRNDCNFCKNSHGAAVDHLVGNTCLLDSVCTDFETAQISTKLKALLNIAGKVQQSGRAVKSEDIVRAKESGASDEEIHDAVLIAAAFCMYNRYVDGLGTHSSKERGDYVQSGERLATVGYN